MKKHTKETCFKIVGYSEWWKDSKPKHRKAATVVGIPQTISSSEDIKREEEAKSQIVHERAVVTQRGRKREKDTNLGNLISGFFIMRQLAP